MLLVVTLSVLLSAVKKRRAFCITTTGYLRTRCETKIHNFLKSLIDPGSANHIKFILDLLNQRALTFAA